MEEETNGIDDFLEDLNRIPSVIDSELLVKDISKAIAQELGNKISL
jgi:hypothetical protein